MRRPTLTACGRFAGETAAAPRPVATASRRAGRTPGRFDARSGRCSSVREERLRDLGGLLVEHYRRGRFREDLLAEACAELVGIDARLRRDRRPAPPPRPGPAPCSCGAPVLRGSHFCPNCGRRSTGARTVTRTRRGSGKREAAIAAEQTCPRCGTARTRGAGLLRRLRPAAADPHGTGCVAAARLAAPPRVVSRRLDLGRPADARRRGRGRGARDRADRRQPVERRHDHRRLVEAAPSATLPSVAPPPRSRRARTERRQPTRTRRARRPRVERQADVAGDADGWTIVLVSYPLAARGRGTPLQTATRAAGSASRRWACSTRTSRACIRATRSSSAASTAPPRTPRRRCQVRAQPVSEAPIRGRSPARRRRPLLEDGFVVGKETICNTPGRR